MKQKTDELDKKILNYMIQNNTTTHKKIAEHLNVTPTTIHKRITKLKKNNILQGNQPIINLKQIGYDVTVVINAQTTKGQLEEAAQKWAKHNNVSSVYRITGEYDIVVIAKFKNTQQLNEFNQKMVKDPLIQRTNTSLVFNTPKENTNPKQIE